MEVGAVELTREHFVDMLRSAGLRVTAARLAVLLALQQHPHAATDTLVRQVRDGLGSVSPQAIYNVVAALSQVGLIRKIEPSGSVPLYELRVADNHHHVVCRHCRDVEDIDCAVGERPCLTPFETHGYLLDEAEVIYWGVCPGCQLTSDVA